MNIHDIHNMFMTFFRPKRMRQLVLLFSVSKNTTVLDVGGFYKNWSYLEDTPQLTLINLGPRPELLPVEVKYVRGDARKLPFADKSFDVVYSNSVIEHVGCRSDQEEMAKEMIRVGKGYYCQTPNYWFFVEPHFLAPIIHWLPIRIRGLFGKCFSLWGLVTKNSLQKSNELAKSIRLLKRYEMLRLFPDAQLINEFFLGFIKSFVAVSRHKKDYVMTTNGKAGK
jgi:hypothetical protein